MSIRPLITRNLRAIFSIVLALFLSYQISAHEPTEPEQDTTHATAEHHAATAHEEGSKKVDITEVAFEHILDSHTWHLWGDEEHPVSFSLPVILKTDAGIVT